MFYGLLNLSVIAVRVASTQRSLGFLQGLLNGFSSCSHSAARTKTLNTSLQPIKNQHTCTEILTHSKDRVHLKIQGEKTLQLKTHILMQVLSAHKQLADSGFRHLCSFFLRRASQNVCMWPQGTKQPACIYGTGINGAEKTDTVITNTPSKEQAEAAAEESNHYWRIYKIGT